VEKKAITHAIALTKPTLKLQVLLALVEDVVEELVLLLLV